MKSEVHFLSSSYLKAMLIKRIDEIDVSGKIKVSISEQTNKSTRCRGLQYLWATEVANSGLGSFDTKEDVHRAAKWKWAVPILIRDNEHFAFIWPELKKAVGPDSEKMKYIIDEFVSTESDGFAIGEYLTDFERYYRDHGVPLTIPDDGLLQWANEQENKNK